MRHKSSMNSDCVRKDAWTSAVVRGKSYRRTKTAGIHFTHTYTQHREQIHVIYRQTVVCKHTPTKWKWKIDLLSTFFSFDWQVIADTNISAIASQVENLSTGSAPSTNPEVRPVEPEWVTSVSTNHISDFHILLLVLITCVLCYLQGTQAEHHHTGKRLGGFGLQYRGRFRESTWRSSYLCQNSLRQGNFHSMPLK